MTLQQSMRQMVPCVSNTSQSFPMFNELVSATSESYKCDCQDVFFDLLCPELNIDGVIYFYKTIFPTIFEAIHKHFEPVETVLKSVTAGSRSTTEEGGPLVSVLRKTYQANWKNIHMQSGVGTKAFARSLA